MEEQRDREVEGGCVWCVRGERGSNAMTTEYNDMRMTHVGAMIITFIGFLQEESI